MGRPKINDHWTRVISFKSGNLDDIKLYEIRADLLLEDAISKEPLKGDQDWSPYFYMKDWIKDHPDKNIENSKLSDAYLKKLGI